MSKPTVFVIMPFGDDFFALYDEIKKNFKERFLFTNAGDLDNQQNILKDIVMGIDNADVVIADLTGLNPNVFYELGLAHTMNKKVIIITQDLGSLPFDIKSYRANEYSMMFTHVPVLIKKLDELLTGALDGSVKFGNPVFDYSSKFKTTIDILRDNSKIESLNIEGGDISPSYFDNIADAEEAIYSIADTVTSLKEEMECMTNDMNVGTNEIYKIKKQQGNRSVYQVREISKKIANSILNFATSFKEKTVFIENNWEIVENNILAVFDIPQAMENESPESFHNFEKSFTVMYKSLDSTRGMMLALRESVLECKGFEKNLTASLIKLDTNIQNYLNLIDKMQSSIERMIEKAKLSIKETLIKKGE